MSVNERARDQSRVCSHLYLTRPGFSLLSRLFSVLATHAHEIASLRRKNLTLGKQQHITSRDFSILDTSMVNMSTSNHSTPRSALPAGSLSRSTVDDFREIIREQSFVLPNGSSADDGQPIEVPVRKYPPLPDIAIPSTSHNHTPFFRTESTLRSPKVNLPKKQMFYHFARTQRGHLPALSKTHLPASISNVMDLDENLPECYSRIPHRAETYTSPNDRVSSPIKRPSAPSPPTSAQIKRPGQKGFAYSEEEQQDDDDEEDDSRFDDVESQLFEENFYRYHHSSNSVSNRYAHVSEEPNRLFLYDDPTPPLNALDLQR